MKIPKKTNVSGQWAKKGEDLKDGDVVMILNGGEIVSGEFGDSHVFKIETRNGERIMRFNQSSLNNLVDAYGDESAGWVGKQAKVWLIKAMVSGKLQNVAYFAHPQAEMNDDGSFRTPDTMSNGEKMPDFSEVDDLGPINEANL